SSTVFPITEAMAEEFQRAEKGKVRVTVGISGTGGGFKKFCRGETDVQDASRPITESELKNCRKAKIQFFEFPVAYDATVVVVNPQNDWLKSITVDELKKIWEPGAQGKITKWNQINKAWPDKPISLYGAGADSGTFDYFTKAIVGKEKSSRGDYTASEDDNTLVQGVASDKYALGYLPYAYYAENTQRLKALPIVGGKKAPKKMTAIMPSKETVEDGTYYPLSRPIFIYVSKKSMDRPEIKKFTEFYIGQAATLVPEAKYVALPAKAYTMAKEHLDNNKVGTAFGGHVPVGLKVEELLKKEKVH
ncbi:MAG TPA: protein sphX, partial [Bdellovibrionales bacterium]|nr:protein sphX [Bdellovibrionales bacterium]